MFDINVIKQAISMIENETTFSPDKWEGDSIEKEVVSIKELPEQFQNDCMKAFYIKKLCDVASAKYKDFSEPATNFYENNSYKKVLTGNEKDLAYNNSGMSVSLDEKSWKEKRPMEYAKVFSEFQKISQRKSFVMWK